MIAAGMIHLAMIFAAAMFAAAVRRCKWLSGVGSLRRTRVVVPLN